MVYHVLIESGTSERRVRETAIDLSEDELVSNYVEPYKRGKDIYISGKWIAATPDIRLIVAESTVPAWNLLPSNQQTLYSDRRDDVAAEWRAIAVTKGRDVTKQFVEGRAGYEPVTTHQRQVAAQVMLSADTAAEAAESSEPAATPATQLHDADPEAEPDLRTVFIVHGWNIAAREALVSFCRALGLKPLTWEQAVKLTGDAAPDTLAVVRTGMSAARAVIVVVTGDDEVRPARRFRGRDATEFQVQPRPNVLVELGMALTINRQRTILARFEDIRDISDIRGLNYVAINNSPESRSALRNRLSVAGCAMDLEDVSYLSTATAGDFDATVRPVGHNDLRLSLTLPANATEEFGTDLTPKNRIPLAVTGRNDGRMPVTSPRFRLYLPQEGTFHPYTFRPTPGTQMEAVDAGATLRHGSSDGAEGYRIMVDTLPEGFILNPESGVTLGAYYASGGGPGLGADIPLYWDAQAQGQRTFGGWRLLYEDRTFRLVELSIGEAARWFGEDILSR